MYTPRIGDIWTGEDSYGNTTGHRVTFVEDIVTVCGEPLTVMSLDHKPATHVEWWFGQGYEPRPPATWSTSSESEMTEEEVRILAADIIGDLLNMRVILDTCSERKLSTAETYITRRIQQALEQDRKKVDELPVHIP